MSTFSAMDIARTGAGFSHHWIDTIAHNIANANTFTSTEDEPFRAVRPVARPNESGPFAAGGSGVRTAGQLAQEGDAPMMYDPGHPLADDEGMVAGPVMDLGGMMTDLLIAQRGYQANMRTITSAREAYESALRLGSR